MPQTPEEFANLAQLYDDSLTREKHYNSLLRSSVNNLKQKVENLEKAYEKLQMALDRAHSTDSTG